MKKIFLLSIFSICIGASFAKANPDVRIYDSEFAAVVGLDSQNNPVIEPLSRNCNDQPQPAMAGIEQNCNPTDECPANTYPVPKYCWGGWSQGWSLCGHACRGNPNGGKGKDHGGKGHDHDGGDGRGHGG